jgi:hypothetical protein
MDHNRLDPEFVVFATPVIAREIMKGANPESKNEIAKLKDLIQHAQDAFEIELDNIDGKLSELAEELFLQGMRDQPSITKAIIDSVIKKSFAVASALTDAT